MQNVLNFFLFDIRRAAAAALQLLSFAIRLYSLYCNRPRPNVNSIISSTKLVYVTLDNNFLSKFQVMPSGDDIYALQV